MLVERAAVRRDVVGQLQLAEGQLDVAHLRDVERPVDRLVVVRQRGFHLLARLQEELVAVEAEAVGLVDGCARLDAQQDVVGLGVRLGRVVQVVRGDERDRQRVGQLDQVRVDRVLVGDAVVLQLDEEAVASEDVLPPARRLTGVGMAPLEDQARHLPVETPGRADEALAVLGEHLHVDAGLVVRTLERRRRRELQEVAVARDVLREDGDVLDRLRRVIGFVLREPGAAGEVQLAAEDRLDPSLAARRVEVDEPVERAVVGDRERRHPELDGLGDELAHARGAVEHRILRVAMQVREVLAGHRPP